MKVSELFSNFETSNHIALYVSDLDINDLVELAKLGYAHELSQLDDKELADTIKGFE